MVNIQAYGYPLLAFEEGTVKYLMTAVESFAPKWRFLLLLVTSDFCWVRHYFDIFCRHFLVQVSTCEADNLDDSALATSALLGLATAAKLCFPCQSL